MLQHHTEHHQRLAGHACQQQARRTDPVFGLALDDGALGFVAAAFGQVHVQAGLAVIAFFKRGVIAGELELMGVLQLQGDFFSRLASERPTQGEQAKAEPGEAGKQA